MLEDEKVLERLLEQERVLVFESFDFAVAKELGLFLLRRATESDLSLTLDITRVQQQLFHIALPGTSVDNDHWIIRKTAVVYRFGHSSFFIGASCRAKGVEFVRKLLVRALRRAPADCLSRDIRQTCIFGGFCFGASLERDFDRHQWDILPWHHVQNGAVREKLARMLRQSDLSECCARKQTDGK